MRGSPNLALGLPTINESYRWDGMNKPEAETTASKILRRFKSSGTQVDGYPILHHEVHQSVGHEQLLIYRCSFSPVYSSRPVLERLSQQMAALGARSYTAYEVLGYWDTICRVWIPDWHDATQFASELSAGLADLGVSRSSVAIVDEVVHHWVWATGPDLSMTTASLSRFNLDPGTSIAEVNELIALTRDRLIPPSMTEAWKELVTANIVAELGHSTTDTKVKFLADIIHDRDRPLTYEDHDELGRMLKEQLQLLAVAGLDRVSLYSTRSSDGLDFFLIGQLNLPALHDDLERLTDTMQQVRKNSYFEIRISIYIALAPTFAIFREELLWDADVDLVLALVNRPTFEQLIDRPESETLEVLPSAYANIRPFLAGGGLQLVESGFTRTIGRALVSLLNADLHGDLIVGLLDRVDTDRRYADEPVHSKIEGWELQNPLYYVPGVDLDLMSMEPGRTLSMDEYRTRIERDIADYIVPSPMGHLEWEILELAGKLLLRIRTRPASSDWYYLLEAGREVFYVRSGTQSKRLKMKQADDFKRTRPRGGPR